MTRAYRSVRPKANRVYSAEDLCKLYRICRNTLSNWVGAGLRPVDDGRPQLFRGAELKWFHDQRSLKRKRALRNGEFKCFTCKARVIPQLHAIRIEKPRYHYSRAEAVCPDCGGKLRKLLGETECDTVRRSIESNTSLQSIDEDEGATPVGIGTKPDQACPTWLAENERIIHAYQIYAGRFDAKTLDAHLISIRHFEAFWGDMPLSAATPAVAGRYREHLIGSTGAKLSRSTIRHRAAHLKGFFDWLVLQEGYRRMNKTLGDYFKLPKSMIARPIQPEPRRIPTSKEVRQLLNSMPTRTVKERRDLAIVAVSFLIGSRASATASLRLGCVDLGSRKVIQDADLVRLKNGKSQTTTWFPLGAPAERIVTSWVNELTDLKCIAEDALFPPDAILDAARQLTRCGRAPIEPWKSDDGVRRAFARGCDAAGLPPFNPHSARHYLKAIRDEYCRTPEQRKAWSHNLGHENEQITESHYAKMTDQRRDEIFGKLIVGDVETEEEKDLLLQYYEHRLALGTPEFERAEGLVDARWKRHKERG